MTSGRNTEGIAKAVSRSMARASLLAGSIRSGTREKSLAAYAGPLLPGRATERGRSDAFVLAHRRPAISERYSTTRGRSISPTRSREDKTNLRSRNPRL